MSEVKEPKPRLSVQEEHDTEMRRLELELKRLQLEEAQQQIDERKLRKEVVLSRSVENGRTLSQIAATQRAIENRCNHKKGGNGAAGIIAGQGDSTRYAVFKHTFAHGDTWIRCLRCGKTWKPPLRESFKSPEEYIAAQHEYERAFGFDNGTVTSTSMPVRIENAAGQDVTKERFRKALAHTTLR